MQHSFMHVLLWLRSREEWPPPRPFNLINICNCSGEGSVGLRTRELNWSGLSMGIKAIHTTSSNIALAASSCPLVCLLRTSSQDRVSCMTKASFMLAPLFQPEFSLQCCIPMIAGSVISPSITVVLFYFYVTWWRYVYLPVLTCIHQEGNGCPRTRS